MRQFKDTKGRAWAVEVTVGGVKAVRGLVGFDLAGVLADGQKTLGELLADPVKLVDVVYVLCKPQADAAGVSDEDFGLAMGGDALEAAADALAGALVDFFPARVRPALTRVMEAGKRVGELAGMDAERAAAAIDPERLLRMLTGSPGSSPAPSGSTPTGSPSAN